MNGRPPFTLQGSARTLFLTAALYTGLHLPVPVDTSAPFYGTFDASAQSIESDIIDDIERQVEGSVADQIEDSVENQLEDTVEQLVEGSIENQIEDSVEAVVEGTVESQVEDSLESQVEDSVEELVEGEVENQIQGAVENLVEEAVEGQVEGSIENLVQQVLENRVEGTIEDEITGLVESEAVTALGNRIEGALNEGLKNIADAKKHGLEHKPAGQPAEGGKGTGVDDRVEIALDREGNRIFTKQWFILTDERSIAALEKKGYLFTQKTRLEGLGGILASVTAPDSHDLTEVRSATLEIVDKKALSIDFNHIYETEAEPKAGVQGQGGIYPGKVMPLPAATGDSKATLGIIDTRVNIKHHTLKKVKITSKHFAADQYPIPTDHGTAVASIISGYSEDYSGVLPLTPLYAASVFFDHPEGGRIATSLGLISALDWLVLSGVEVINMSLAGPANALLETALRRVRDKGVIVVAAVGNSGPASKPLYPAGYDSVVAVTAVSETHAVYRRAVRGKHLDLAAPGVQIVHADTQGALAVSSGTSMAAPFVAACLYREKIRSTLDAEAILKLAYTTATDLGEEGHDPVFGYGLVRFTHNESLVKNDNY